MIRRDGSVSRMAIVIIGLVAGMASAAVVATPPPGPVTEMPRAA